MDHNDTRRAAENLGISAPQSAADLRRLLEQFGPALTPQNRAFITELLRGLDSGDREALERLAQRMGAGKK